MVLPQGHRGNFPPVTPPQKFRAACYTIEGINSFAVVIYFSYLYFFFKHQFGFDDRQNLLLAALIGLVYTIASWQAGKLAGRFGYFNAMKFGFGLMAAGLVAGLLVHTVAAEIVTASVANIGMCFIWPTIEALVSEGDTPDHVPHAVGIYNITWAAANAVAFFIGGTLIQKFGYQSIFYVPLAMVVVQFCLVFWLEKIHPKYLGTLNLSHSLRPSGERDGVRGFELENRSASSPRPSPPLRGGEGEAVGQPDPNRPSPARAKTFLRMAWLANPFAYVAINTLLAVLPGIADKFALSPMFTGFICSLWCFVRLGAFVVLWRWTGWHYRFGWLAVSFAMLILSFAAILLAPGLGVLVAAQIFFGWAIGLIYYSSLFYSMDASETKSEHGGIHEAAIGLGNFIGPGMGAAALYWVPQYANSGAIAVSVLLLGGFGGLLAIWKTAR
jgi:predicted MFS family arabinose efflux permease